jgi:dipeptidyl aminopeptidase/acylaminoacyl peptidase
MSPMRIRRHVLSFAAFGMLVAAGTPLLAQSRQLTAEDYARAERFLAPQTVPLVTGFGVRPTWLPDGRFWYRTTAADGAAFYVVDPAKRSRTSLFDARRLATALAAATGARVDASRLPFQSVDLEKDNRGITVSLQGKRWRCDIQQYACTTADTNAARAAGETPPNSSVSPDGRRAVFIRDYNLWVKELATGKETQLTSDGVKDFGYATDNAGWVHSPNPVVSWSPDSRRVATFQHDGRGAREMALVSTNVGAPTIDIWKYPMPGDSIVFRITRVVIDVDTPKVTRLQMAPDFHRSTVSDHVNCGGELCDLQWFPDGARLAFVSSSREHKHAWFRVADARTGEVKTLFEETSKTQIGDASLNEHLWKILPASNELIWWSQKEGWLQLYLHDLATGRLKNRITSGEGNVDEIVRVDEKSRTIFFLGAGKEPGRDPYFQHLYRIGFDGKGLKLLTPEVANHVVSVSPDGRYFADSWSTPDTPPTTVLRDMNGRLVQQVEKADIARLLATGWRPPTPFTVKARDGKTDIYGLMFTPSNLDSTKKYPIIDYIYPGPQSGSVGSRSFTPARGDHQALAELGFVVVAIDGMGTPGRSKAFMDAYYGRMGDNTIPDQVAAIKELARRHRFIDVDKVGIWGHSGGGFATASAMFKFTDFFDVGIAESGNHDNRNYEDDWGERYQGLLERSGSTDNYADEANQTHARNLRGKLMLVHGEMDDNVPVQNTRLVVDALVKAGKDFDLLMLPHARHGYGVDNAYVMRRRWDYFVKNLQGNEPPNRNEPAQRPAVP